ncbi:MAG: hypothetical protein RL732_1179 [Bacteroidota bacterium]|jgi:hypothetical protein
MRRIKLPLISFLLVAVFTHAQDIQDKKVKYRRSALHTILVETESFPNIELVTKTYNNAPFPDNYDNHTLPSLKSLNPKLFPITDADRKAAGTEKTAAGQLVGDLTQEVTGGIIEKNAADMPLIINKYIQKNKLGGQLVGKWYGRNAQGLFDSNMELMKTRGSYDATALDVKKALATEGGLARLSDAGEELIKNTFVVFSKMNFVPNEVVAAAVRDAAKIAAQGLSNPLAQQGAIKAADLLYNKTKDGYSVWTISYLYRLKWDDSIQNVFYTDYWLNSDEKDSKKIAARKTAFENSNLFQMEFVGKEMNAYLIMPNKDGKTEDKLIERATVRSVEGVFNKLQKKYEVFKPKFPLFSGDPVAAKIGRKEGLEGGEKFEVLEQVYDEKTGRTKYDRVGTITVDDKKVWDNRYGAEEEAQKDSKAEAVDKTYFKGGKKLYAGQLIRQIKS